MASLAFNGADVNVRRLPPSDNMGVSVTSSSLFSIHFLTFTVWDSFDNVYLRLSNTFPTLGDVYELGHGGRGYKRQAVFLHGVRAWWEPVSSSSETRVTVSFSGAFLEGVELASLFKFMKDLRDSARVQITRLDLAYDSVPFTPATVKDAFLAGRVRTVAHRDSWGWYENVEGRTFTIGSRSSERFVRVYDRRGSTRFEIEIKSRQADALFWLLADSDISSVPVLGLEFIRGYVDFCEPSGANRSRWPLLSWWKSFVEGVGKIRVVVPLAEKTVERLESWLIRQVAPSLAFMSVLSPCFLGSLIDSGKSRLSRWHCLVLRQLEYA